MNLYDPAHNVFMLADTLSKKNWGGIGAEKCKIVKRVQFEVQILRSPDSLSPPHICPHYNYLCTYDLYILVHNILDACIFITRRFQLKRGRVEREKSERVELERRKIYLTKDFIPHLPTHRIILTHQPLFYSPFNLPHPNSLFLPIQNLLEINSNL
jgi:hypothetical protein